MKLLILVVLLLNITFAKAYTNVDELVDAVKELNDEERQEFARELIHNNNNDVEIEDQDVLAKIDEYVKESKIVDNNDYVKNSDNGNEVNDAIINENLDHSDDEFDDELYEIANAKKKDPFWFFTRRRRRRRTSSPKPAPRPKPIPTGNKPPADKVSCLKEHNKYRQKHQGTPDLVWNSALASRAQAYANTLASRDNGLKHASTSDGENLYGGYGLPMNKACAQAIKLWYDEISHYNYNSPGFSMATGHFTQVIWKGSKQLGVGIAKSNRGRVFVVGRYSPAGNSGWYRENVRKLN